MSERTSARGGNANVDPTAATSTERDKTLLERGEEYLLLKMERNLSNREVATIVGASIQTVEQLLLLAGADEPIKALVRLGKISGSTVIKAIRAQRRGGEDALLVVVRMVAAAEKRGLSRAMPKHDPVQAGPRWTRKVRKSIEEVLSHLATDQVLGELRQGITEEEPRLKLNLTQRQGQALLLLLECLAPHL